MQALSSPKPARPTRCPDCIEVDPGEREIAAATVKTWLAHLRSHGWTDRDLDIQWLTRARHGFTR